MRLAGRWRVLALIGLLSGPIAVASRLTPEPEANTVINPNSLYDALLDALYATFGNHPGFRVTHAKGVLVSGTFVASAAAGRLSIAPHLQGQPVSVLLRFSNFSGLPATPDGDPMASPHGLAIRFALPDDQATDIVAHSFNGFPVATPEEFLSFLQGIAANAATPPNPAPLQTFLAGHSRAKAFLDNPKPAPRSYLSSTYFGVNALLFKGPDGVLRAGRYRIEPLQIEATLNESQAAQPADYLQHELAHRLGRATVTLRLMLQLAQPADVVSDGSIPWPESNPKVELGQMRLDRLIPFEEQIATQQRLDFNPGRLPLGITPSSDPMVGAREGIYQRALIRRQQH